MELLSVLGPASPLTQAWAHTEAFAVQTWSVLRHHPLAVLVCAVVPAAERGYVLLRGRQLKPGQLGLLEGVVTLWRLLLCGVAIWAACSGYELRELRARVGAVGAWQLALDQLGDHIAHHLRAELWELLFFAAGLLLGILLIRWAVRGVARASRWMRETPHQRATVSVLWNLVLVPMAVIYLVEMARPALQ